MSPSRPTLSKRNSSGVFKPYKRGATSTLYPTASDLMQESKQLADMGASGTMITGNNPSFDLFTNDNDVYVPVERPGFPTFAQYKQVEATYIHSLTPRRQGKALISQALFDRIWDVLHQPDAQGETAQFRFWARKMFTLSKTHQSTLGVFGNTNNRPQEVLLHDNLLVAVQEQLYDLLCYCHRSTGHGGRDKTCALIRKHYTWVPKDLVSNFIKACPTCIMKKCGTIDSATLANQIAEQRAEEDQLTRLTEYFTNYDAGPEGPVAAPGIPWPVMGRQGSKPASLTVEEADPIEVAYREAVLRARGVKASFANITSASRGFHGVPMSREVSLYKGLPNGWQHRHDDYADAYAEFMQNKDFEITQDGDLGVRAQRPRVPSILPLWSPDYFAQEEYKPLQEADLTDPTILSFTPPNLDVQQQQSAYLFMTQPQQHPEEQGVKEEPFEHQIDPLLLKLSADSNIPYEHASDGSSTDFAQHQRLSTSCTMSTSLKRRAAPPRLRLDSKAMPFKGFKGYYGSMRGGAITPDSPIMGIDWQPAGSPSPTGSDGSSNSGSSQLSAFPALPPMSTTTTVSPLSSAMPTPVDESTSILNVKNDGRSSSTIKG